MVIRFLRGATDHFYTSFVSERKKVYFISLNYSLWLPYAYGTLRSFAEDHSSIRSGYEFKEPLILLQSVSQILDEIEAPDVICFSCYIWNFNQHMSLAKGVKDRYPHCKVIAGGPHIPRVAETFFHQHPYVDFLIHDEGEGSFRDLLLEILKEESADYTRVRSLSFRAEERVVTTPTASLLPHPLPIESPFLRGYLDGWLQKFQARNTSFGALWETNRGCPYGCSFCDWGVNAVNRLRPVDMARIVEEIDYFSRKRIETVYIADANFGILERDEEIAERLAFAKHSTGYPRTIRASFAKNSSDRVLRISQIFARNHMSAGTTLSMQSNDGDVLRAVRRENIGTQRFHALASAYRAANIHTYTELILGLPKETKSSFRKGLCDVLEQGNHEDVRVYELVLLPNAPLNTQEQRRLHGLQTVIRPLYAAPSGVISETAEVVVATNSMSREDWIDSFIFAEFLQVLHNGGYTRFLAQYLRRSKNISYLDFYVKLLEYFADRPSMLLGELIARVRKLLQDYLDSPTIPQMNKVNSQLDMVADLYRYHPSRKWLVFEWLWLRLNGDSERFYEEFNTGVDLCWPLGEDLYFQDAIRFQSEIMLRPDFDPTAGKLSHYSFDWIGYFKSEASLPEARPLTLTYHDERMGFGGRFPLRKDDLRAFTLAALGDLNPFSKNRHFFHQFDTARIGS